MGPPRRAEPTLAVGRLLVWDPQGQRAGFRRYAPATRTRSEQVGDLKSELVEKREELQAERKQKEQFAAKLRELGIDPDQL